MNAKKDPQICQILETPNRSFRAFDSFALFSHMICLRIAFLKPPQISQKRNLVENPAPESEFSEAGCGGWVTLDLIFPEMMGRSTKELAWTFCPCLCGNFVAITGFQEYN